MEIFQMFHRHVKVYQRVDGIEHLWKNMENEKILGKSTMQRGKSTMIVDPLRTGKQWIVHIYVSLLEGSWTIKDYQ